MKHEQLEQTLGAAHRAGLGLTSLRALLFVNEAKRNYTAFKLTDLSTLCGVSTAAMTGQADRLEADGLVKRDHSDKDRRSVHLVITDKGEALAKKILNA